MREGQRAPRERHAADTSQYGPRGSIFRDPQRHGKAAIVAPSSRGLAAPNGFDLEPPPDDDDGYDALPAFVLLGLSCRRGRTPPPPVYSGGACSSGRSLLY